MVGHPCIADGQAVDVQLQWASGVVGRLFIGGGLGRLRCCIVGWRFASGRTANTFPVAAALLVAVERQIESVECDVAHLHFAAQQRQHPDRKTQHAQVGKGLFRCLHAGQGGVVQFQAEPREQAPADVAGDVQFEPGLFASKCTDLVFIVVGVEQMREGKAQCDDKEQQPEDYQAQDLAERFHGQVLCVWHFKSSEYNAGRHGCLPWLALEWLAAPGFLCAPVALARTVSVAASRRNADRSLDGVQRQMCPCGQCLSF